MGASVGVTALTSSSTMSTAELTSNASVLTAGGSITAGTSNQTHASQHKPQQQTQMIDLAVSSNNVNAATISSVASIEQQQQQNGQGPLQTNSGNNDKKIENKIYVY